MRSVAGGTVRVARAREVEPTRRILRIGYSYDHPVEPGAVDSLGRPAVSNSGLLFGSWQADVAAQYMPMQDRLAQADLLNTWTTPIGSTVVAILPGCHEGGFVGETLVA